MKQLSKKWKIITGLSALGVLAATVSVAATSCKQQAKLYKIFPTYVSQADNLLTLGIAPDFYPTQLFWKKKSPFDYMNALQPQTFQPYIKNKPVFAQQLTSKLASLENQIQNYDPSWFSFSGNAYNEGRSEEYWYFNKGSMVLYERYLFDSSHFQPGAKTLELQGGPITKNSHAYPTDFKASRDLFLTLSPEQINNFNSQPNTQLRQNLKLGLQYQNEQKGELYPLYNYAHHAQQINERYLHDYANLGFDFWNSNFAKFIIGYEKTADNKIVINQNAVPIFAPSSDWHNQNSLNSKIYYLINNLVLSEKEKNAGVKQLNYRPDLCSYNLNDPLPLCAWNGDDDERVRSILHHHPVYEQNLRLDGGAQIYLGSMRESMLYLYDIAYWTVAYAHSPEAAKLFANDPERLNLMKNALNNANHIAGNLYARLAKMRLLFQKLGLVDPRYDPTSYKFNNDKSLAIGLLTTFERNGTSTLQTISKYGFLYYDLGFRGPQPHLKGNAYQALLQPVANKIPKGCHIHDNGDMHCLYDDGSEAVKKAKESITNSILNMDDHGWWWNLGTDSLEAGNFSKFNNNFDVIFNLSKNKKSLFANHTTNTYINAMLTNAVQEKTVQDPKILSKNVFIEDYTLWTEGIRSPIGYNQILDATLENLLNLVSDDLKAQYKTAINDAYQWGDYWDQFVQNK
ncbi:iron ABC transporter substrate-binding protein [Ureaplasma miroungigenitalium]|uniref:Iron ABC transporter substrate-binding protein n=1 Tax=Ureaplasma miroungigenitalium TaxID=1042321 RepID=A0ABT3BNM0_9BACT|nr:iron ABC transporter substrate-binding protein [Ureaplasma miroungigenitalium]MCV3728691.1 iron ABC transporter substrate-binding protein [Ureaplasma miroungigenitalium]